MDTTSIEAAGQACRLCGGPTIRKFEATLLDRYAVGYWRCDQCRSLQTDPPTWLDEAYRDTIPVYDTGMVSRTLQMTQLTAFMLHWAGVGEQMPCLDFGGGNGLFCRMMRDQGFNFLNYDRYATPYYCTGFSVAPDSPQKFDVVTSFELFEHLPDPRTDLEEVLRFQPKLWLLSTQLYRGEGPDWEYLSCKTGRHVFFYAPEALALFGARHGYEFLPGRQIHMFLRKQDNNLLQAPLARRAARAILAGRRWATIAALLSFERRQRRAYRRWRADSNDLLAARAPTCAD